MRKDYFSEILKIHTASRTEDFSSFCELHELTSDKDKHNSIFCNLADWDNSFTELLKILEFKEKSLQDVCDDEYRKFLKVAIPSYLFWMNVLHENLQTFNDFAFEKKLVITKKAWKDSMPNIQFIHAWTNFHKHPGHVLKIHHPEIAIADDRDGKNSKKDIFVFDCKAANNYFDGSYEARKKQNELPDQPIKWVIQYPNFIQLHEKIMEELGKYLAELKEKISHDQTYKEWIEGLYNKPWAEIQD